MWQTAYYHYWICRNQFWSYVIWRCILSKRCIIRLIPHGIPLIAFTYLSSEQKCLRRSVSSAVWDGIRSDFSIYPPPSSSSTSPPLQPLISCSHFMMTGNPAGLEGRHLSSHSQEGIFLSNMCRPWFKCTSKELWSFPRLPFLLQIKTMTVKSVNHQMYDNHFPQAHYCSAHGRGTRFIIMLLPLLQLWWCSTILVTFSKGEACSWQSIVCIYLGNRKAFTITLLCKTGNYGCNDPCSVQQGNPHRRRIGIKFIRCGCEVPAQLNLLMHFTVQCLCNFTTEY